MVSQKTISANQIRDLIEHIQDPEIPVLTIKDLGILQDVALDDEGNIEIVITPTYSGCPAMDMIAMNIRLAMLERGYENFTITQRLAPAWTTDWMTDEGKQKLRAYGIAPPGSSESQQVTCPQCGSGDTRLLSQFGSTACKALYQCNECKEPFDYFKCH